MCAIIAWGRGVALCYRGRSTDDGCGCVRITVTRGSCRTGARCVAVVGCGLASFIVIKEFVKGSFPLFDCIARWQKR